MLGGYIIESKSSLIKLGVNGSVVGTDHLNPLIPIQKDKRARQNIASTHFFTIK